MRRNNVGIYKTANDVPIAIGIPGEADLTLFAKRGQTIFVEIKTPTGRQSEQQKKFEKAVTQLGYKYVIMRSVEEARRLVERLKNDNKRN